MTGIGKMITGKLFFLNKNLDTAKALKLSQMAQDTLEISSKVLKKERVSSTGLTMPLMKETSNKVTFTAKVSTNGPTAESTKVTGKKTQCTVKVSSHGRMAEDMKVHTTITKKKATVNSFGQTVKFTREIGRTENRMGTVS